MKGYFRCLLLALLASAASPAFAQSCSIAVDPTLEFGTLVGLPTPATVVTANINVTCNANRAQGIKVCVGVGAGTGTGSTVGDRRMSITTPAVDNIAYALYQDAALSVPLGIADVNKAPVSFAQAVGLQVRTVTVYGRLTPGQTAKSVGNYLSNLPVTAVSFNGNHPSCNGTGFLEDVDAFDAHLRLNPACTVTAAPLDFGSVSGLTGHDAATNLAVTCTLNGPYNIALNGGSVTGNVGSREMRLGAGPNTIGYQLYRDSGRTQVWGDTTGLTLGGTGNGATQSIPVYGRVPVQVAKPAGTYVDTVTATVTF